MPDLDPVFDELVRRLSAHAAACFNSTRVDDALFDELDALTARGGKLDAERGLLR
jgi:hypothetical protein